MAYKNYLVKLGNYIVDEERFMLKESYEFNEEPIDVNSTRVQTGHTRRNVLDYIPLNVKFTMPPMLTNEDIKEFFGKIAENYVVKKERTLYVTAYNPEIDDYEYQLMYMVKPKFAIKETAPDLVFYKSIEIQLIGN